MFFRDWLTKLRAGSKRNTRQRNTSTRLLRVEPLESRCLLTDYDVGIMGGLTDLASVPWSSLQPGDNVYIHGRAEPYHEFILLTESGTAAQPIRVRGVLGPNGEVPVIDGEGAVQSPSLPYSFQAQTQRGLITVSLAKDDAWGYKPAYLEISGLEVRNANQNESFTAADGSTKPFFKNAAGVFVERGENITISDMNIHGNGNGLFVASNDSEAMQSRHISVLNNTIQGNGNAGSDREHNIYTEAIDILFEGNYLGPLAPGALGNNLKDRSAGTIIRYNWIYSGAHLLDLVDAEDSMPQVSLEPSYLQTFVYGNVLIDPAGDNPAGRIVHYGGDSGSFPDYRNGTLYFYNNTVIVQANLTGPNARYFTSLFQLDTNSQHVDARNNIIDWGADPTSPPDTSPGNFAFVFNEAGQLNLGVNWINPGWHQWRNDDVPVGGQVTGVENLLAVPDDTSPFVDLSSYDLALASGSLPIDASDELAPAAQNAGFIVDREFQFPRGTVSRTITSGATDLGAFEAASVTGPGRVQWSSASLNVAENAGQVVLQVKRLGGSTGTVEVDLQAVDGTALLGTDYSLSTTHLTWEDGQTTAEVILTLIDNAASGPNKTFQLQLTNPSGGATLGVLSSLSVTIQNDEPTMIIPPTLKWPQRTLVVDPGSTQVTIQVTRDGDLTQPSSVRVTSKNGSAKAGREYTAVDQVLQFSSGQSTQTVTVTLTPARIHGKESFLLHLSRETGGRLPKANRKLKVILQG